mgnify:CR=1 FL=1
MFNLIPKETNIPFVKLHKFGYFFSTIIVITSIFFFLFKGLNYGIDFKGGTLVEIGTENSVKIEELRLITGNLALGDVQIQKFGTENNFLIRVEERIGGESSQQESIKILKNALAKQIVGNIQYRRVEVVGPKVSSELIQKGTMAVIIAVVTMLIYIWVRFEWQFSLGAVIALIHDVLISIGVFSLAQIEFNLSIIAALLTIVGYSMNDTVVVYDRVRENLRKFKRMEMSELLNLSINNTLSRTVITSLTTLLALFCLYFLGGEIIKGFAFAMMLGVVVGTYSSIFIAVPLLLVFKIKRE